MTRPLSLDLRERVVASVLAGESCRSVAERFGVRLIEATLIPTSKNAPIRPLLPAHHFEQVGEQFAG